MKTLAILLGITLCAPGFAGARPKQIKTGGDLLRRTGKYKREKERKKRLAAARARAEEKKR